MTDSLDSVNAAARLYQKWIDDRPEGASARAIERWVGMVDGLVAAANELVQRRAWARPVPAAYGDISDLPDELLAQLSGVKTDELEDRIYTVVKASEHSIELDRLLIELYRRFGEVHERRFLNNKCYRMAQKRIIHSVPGRKGVYSIHPQNAAELPVNEGDNSGGYESGPRTTGPKETFTADLDDEIPF